MSDDLDLDAAAAADHHKAIFENEVVRVLEPRSAPTTSRRCTRI